MDGPRRSSGAFVCGCLWWTGVGAAVGVGVAGILTVGVFFLGLALVMTLVGLKLPVLRENGWPLVLAGAAVAPLYVAWLNKEGPGDVCRTEGATFTCTEMWSPWPFVVVALVLVGVGVALTVRAAATWCSYRP